MGKSGNGKRGIDCIHILPSGGNSDFHDTVEAKKRTKPHGSHNLEHSTCYT
jgi:hypothetical protein